MDEYFTRVNGQTILDADLSDKMYRLKELHPERVGDTDSGYEWSEMGIAALFGELYNSEARYCPEHKSWYT